MRQAMYVLAVSSILGCGRTGLGVPEVLGGDDSSVDDASLGDAIDDEPDFRRDAADVGPDALPKCGPTNCTGCCQSDGSCAGGQTLDACGMNGEACEQCPKDPNSYCNKPGPGCITQLAECTPQNCDGCCFLYPKPNFQFCSSGVHAKACGHNGEACQICGSGQCLAVSGGGKCQGSPPCTPNNCSGCCAGNICAIGVQDIACGTGGVVCADCDTNGKTCVGNVCK